MLNRYYVGFTTVDIHLRLSRHIQNYYKNKYTARANDWEIYIEIECVSIEQARNIEAHIKKMKSKTYIENLKKYPEIIQKLLVRYSKS